MNTQQKLTTIFIVAILSLAIVGLFNPMDFTLEAFKFQIRFELAQQGKTTLSFPPLGSLNAPTHLTPVHISLSLTGIDIDILEENLESGQNQKDFIELMIRNGKTILKQYLIRVIVLAFAGGILGALLLKKNSFYDYFRFGIVGVVFVGVLVLGTVGTYQVEELKSPQFNGALKAAPWVVDLAEEAIVKFDNLGSQLKLMADNFQTIFDELEAVNTLGNTASDIKVLHVSDIHNNVATFKLIKEIVNKFAVDFIIDTGDMSDYGTALEGLLTKEIEELPVPYVFVPGNHDSPTTMGQLQKHENLIVLDEEFLEISGIRIFGVADADAYGERLFVSAGEKHPGHIDEIREILENTPPDIVAVHRPSLAKKLAGFAPIILHGHDHQGQVYTLNDSLVINAGTSGAAGIRRLLSPGEVPFSLVLLHFKNENASPYLTCIDFISFYENSSRLVLERHLINIDSTS